ncbi:MAG: hypothetical protein JSS86_06475 [Cyanobacteria bacterium SZAS LIN-2]|nr:hypothetical protein [Cyanobacteria bacterium SZAS LIN-2]MBS2010625.1 hypothetical protein [Cyanobacteria bacterium SZAS TMP-1]
MITVLGVSLIGVLYLVLILALFAFWLYGLILTVRASLILTLLCLLLHVPFIVFGAVKFGFGVDLPRAIVDALRNRN